MRILSPKGDDENYSISVSSADGKRMGFSRITLAITVPATDDLPCRGTLLRRCGASLGSPRTGFGARPVQVAFYDTSHRQAISRRKRAQKIFGLVAETICCR